MGSHNSTSSKLVVYESSSSAVVGQAAFGSSAVFDTCTFLFFLAGLPDGAWFGLHRDFKSFETIAVGTCTKLEETIILLQTPACGSNM